MSTKETMAPSSGWSRRGFLATLGVSAVGAGLLGRTARAAQSSVPAIQGFEQAPKTAATSAGWKPVSDRRIRVGIAGYGVCQFGAQFGFQNHPNVEIVAVTDIIPDRCAGLAKACRCEKTYPSCEEMIKDDRIEAVFVATDAPSHARLCIAALERGKHVACAVPAVFGSVEDAYALYDAVKRSKRNYMMFETSAFHKDLFEIREIYKRGGFGKLLYSEGEYYHYAPTPSPSYKGWRVGIPPQYYPTHSNAYYVATGAGHFTEVSCPALPSIIETRQPANNRYKNPFGTEIATFKTSEGGVSRMAVSFDTPGPGAEAGRVRGQKGSYYGKYEGLEKIPTLSLPPLPPQVNPGSHGGSHGYLMNEFVLSILENRQPLVDISMALNMTVPGIIAHQSALKGGEWLKVPYFAPIA